MLGARINSYKRLTSSFNPSRIFSVLPQDKLDNNSSKSKSAINSSVQFSTTPIVLPPSDSLNSDNELGKRLKRPLSFNGKLKVVKELSKFSLSSLVVFTSAAGYMCYGGYIDYGHLAATVMGTALCSASAATFNQVFEKDYDKLMRRTRARPLPSERISVKDASIVGALWGVSGVSLLGLCTGPGAPVVASLGLANIFLYSGLYTYSKRISENNTYLGSVVGAIPPLMGYAAASGGNLLAGEPLILFSLLFLWQLPHFFALSYMYRDDYKRGGFKMVSLNDDSGERSSKLIKNYLYLTASIPFISTMFDYTSYMYLVENLILSGIIIQSARNFHDKRDNQSARKIFLNSLWYLPFLLIGFILHSNKTWETIDDETKEKDAVSDDFFFFFLFFSQF